MHRLPAFLIALALFAHPGDAVSVPFQTLRKARPPRSRVLATTSDSQAFGFRNLDYNNVYVANILVGGVPFSVRPIRENRCGGFFFVDVRCMWGAGAT